tara:strand:+ start:286 stop:873 length:588 start_codon:yes stop_codon:yes gene_type:complete
MIRRKLKKILSLSLSLLCTTALFAQNGNLGLRDATAEILGVANDTAFIAKSRQANVLFSSATSKLIITLPIETIRDNHPQIDSCFQSQKGINLVVDHQVEGNVFRLFEDENSNHNSPFFGTLNIGAHSQRVSGNYRIYRTIGKFSSGDKTNANMGPMLLDVNLFFEPTELNKNPKLQFSNPVELILSGAYINQMN